MPVIYTRLTNNPITLQTLMQQLDANLIAAGWTREFVDAEAATGGSGAPGWGKVPAVNTTAGFVVYQMPASGNLTRWFIRVEAGWGASTQNFTVRTNSATGVNASTGALSGAGTNLGWNIASTAAANASGDNYAVASEHGFLLGINLAGLGFFTGVERRRTLAGTYTSDLVSYVVNGGSNSNLNAVGWSTFNNLAAQNLVRSLTGGEFGAQPLALLMGSTGINTNSPAILPGSYNLSSNTLGYPAGFFTSSGGLRGMLRLIQAWLPNDCSPLSAQTVNVDGADQTYFAIGGSSPITPNGCRLLIAMT